MVSFSGKTNIWTLERRFFSQHGEDGIIQGLSKLVGESKTFLEIGCSTGAECNSRYLLELGWSGTGIDLPENVAKYGKLGLPIKLIGLRVTPDNLPEFEDVDVFSLDIDSYDYWIAKALLERGFRPKVACVETNTFLPETTTCPYSPNFSRYRYQPKYGLYFGCSLGAWRYLWEQYGYTYCGMDMSNTNAFFILGKHDFHVPIGDYQTYFCRKYGMDGEELSKTITEDQAFTLIDVTKDRKKFAVATTFTASGYDLHGKKFMESFAQYWPADAQLIAYPEGFELQGRELHKACPLLVSFKNRHTFKPGNYVYDAVKWSHRIFALQAAMNECDADILINIDSDIVTFADIDSKWLEGLLGDADIAYMPRQDFYSECSFVLYRLNPTVRRFINDHIRFYTEDLIFRLKDGWTDCHAFDVLVDIYQRNYGLKVRNINEGIPDCMHPFVNGPLGSRMDHMKGARKTEGKSRKTDLVVPREEAYWQ